MGRRTWGALLLTGLLLAITATAHAEQPPPQPNIIFIMADDMGWGDPQAYNPESQIPTPHMDALAEQGIRFTDAHSPSAVCTPTRYALLTGRSPWRTRLESGVLWGYSRALIEPGRLTIGQMLQERGYHTAGVGKWHLGLQAYDPDDPDAEVDYEQPLRPGPVTQGFDYFFGIPASLDMEPYVWVVNDELEQQPTAETEGSAHRRQDGGGFWRAGPMAPDFDHHQVHPRITQKSVAYIEERAEHDEPFFLYVPLASPHTPWLPNDPFRGLSDMDTHGGYYGDFVAEVDWTVGQIDDALARTGLTDNTLLIVTSDNGAHWPVADIEAYGHRANGPFRGQKADIHEGGHRVPFIARWPGHTPEDAVSDQLLCLTDMMATFGALLEYELPEDAAEDSFNLLPALLGEDDPEEALRPLIVNHSLNGQLAYREGPWKLIPGNLGTGGFTGPRVQEPGEDDPGGQLYNLDDDIAEQNNLWEEEPEKVDRLKQALQQVRESGRSR